MGNHREVSSLPPGRRVWGLHRQQNPGLFPNCPPGCPWAKMGCPTSTVSFHGEVSAREVQPCWCPFPNAPDFHPEASSSPMPPEVAVAQELTCELQSIATAPLVTSWSPDAPAKAPEGCPPVSPSLSSASQRRQRKRPCHDGRFHQVHAGRTHQEPRSRHRRRSPGPWMVSAVRCSGTDPQRPGTRLRVPSGERAVRHLRHQEDQNDAVPPTRKRPVRAFQTLHALIVCCGPCLWSRSPGGPSICRSWSRRTTTRLTHIKYCVM